MIRVLLLAALALGSSGAEWKARKFERAYRNGRLEFSLSTPKEWTLKERDTSLEWSRKEPVLTVYWLDPDKVYDVESVCRAGMCEELGGAAGVRVARPTPERRKAMGLSEKFLYGEAVLGVGVYFKTDKLTLEEFKKVLATFKVPEEGFTACGCGCCGGTQPEVRCLRKKGELERLKAQDEAQKTSPDCARMGCGRGIVYKVCDGR